MTEVSHPLPVRAYRRLLSREQRNEIARVRKEGLRRLVKVCSHPRSGTHLTEVFLARNFYAGRDLGSESVRWGHWSEPRVDLDGNPTGKLFGSHAFPSSDIDDRSKIVYVYRDGRAVAHSIWRTDNFVHPDMKRDLTFAGFLRTPIDWRGAPDVRAEPTQTIAQHWHAHVEAWMAAALDNPNILVVRYEDLCAEPEAVRELVRERFFPKQAPADVTVIDRPVGLLPNAATIDAWRDAFTDEDDAFFRSQLPHADYLWTD